MRDHPRPAAWEGFRAILGVILAAHGVASARVIVPSGRESFSRVE
jgi:hypothetical protein